MINLKEFIKCFRNTNYYNTLIANKSLIMIYVGGSYLWNMTDELSDLDICLVYREFEDYQKELCYTFLEFHGVKGHFYADDLKEPFLNKKEGCKWFNHYRAITLGILKEDNIIYKNNNYSKIIEYIFNNQKRIFKNAVYLSYKEKEDSLLPKLSVSTFNEKELNQKFLYHFLMYSYYLTDEMPNKNFVLKVKRNKKNSLSEEDKKLISERLTIIKNFVDSYIPEYETIQSEINAIISEIKNN